MSRPPTAKGWCSHRGALRLLQKCKVNFMTVKIGQDLPCLAWVSHPRTFQVNKCMSGVPKWAAIGKAQQGANAIGGGSEVPEKCNEGEVSDPEMPKIS